MNSNFDLAIAHDAKWQINGEKPRRPVREHLKKHFTFEIDDSVPTKCPYCHHALRNKSHKQFNGKTSGYVKEADVPWEEIQFRHYVLSTCSNCAYWMMNGCEVPTECMDPSFLLSAASVTAKFSTNSPDGCSEELAQYIRRNTDAWHQLSPYRMETLVADIFRANHVHCEVKHVGGPGDLGIDVLFIDDNQTKWLIQVKRREKPNKAEGFSTLQSILGTLALHGERHGIIVSTADYFSRQLKREVKNAAKQGYTIELIDKGVLNRIVGRLLPRNAWRSLFTHPDASIISDLRSNFTNFQQDTFAVGFIRDSDAGQISELYQEPKFINPNQLSLFP